MISVEEARTRILSALAPVAGETVALGEAHGRVLAAPVLARLTQPPADVSAMDGYALRAVDAQQGAVLRVIGAAPAGQPYGGEIGPGEAVRLFTGSVVPAGADTVLLQEDAEISGLAGEQLTVTESCQPGRHIRRAGQDFRAGDELIAAGTRFSARHIGLAAAANHPWVTVHRRPLVAILATGDEISLPGEPIGPGGIVSSNAHALAAFVQASGGTAMVLPIAGDDREAIAAGADAARHADLLVTTGGASVGDHDLVRAGLQARGLALDFWRIAMRPGKPLMFGRMGELPLLGLPGNPVSAYVCALLFLRPALARLGGLAETGPETEPARLASPMKANDRRADFVRAALRREGDFWLAAPFAVQDSAMLHTLAAAGALILREPFAPAAGVGDIVRIIRLGASGL